MNYGLNMAAAGVMTALARQDVAANNLANVGTVAFKPDSIGTVARAPAREEDGLGHLPSNALLERLGAGVLLSPTRTSFKQGALLPTGNDLDLGIEGEGFLTVAIDGSGRDPGSLRLTRDGRLTLRPDGRLVTVADGYSVMDAQGRPIGVDPTRGPVVIDERGRLSQNGQPVAELAFDRVPTAGLRKLGNNLFAPTSSALASRTPAVGFIRQGHVEQSAVDPIQAMMAVQNAANAVASSTRLMQIHDELIGRAINTLGRVA